jgi:predicted NBD/HSP70 family sugar kinase
VRTAVNLDWRDLPLANMLKEEFKLPTYVANDCQAAALAEFTFNRRGRENNLVVVKVGRGIGAGIILEGKLFYGDNFGAGEIGHMEIVKGGELCRCGNYGCLETVASSRAMVRRARILMEKGELTLLSQLVSSPNEINTDIILEAFEAGDPDVQSLVNEIGQQLGFAIAHLVCALNINRVVIAGSLARFGDGLIQSIRENVEQGALPALSGETRIEISPLGRDIVILGAASLILSNEIGLV